ncbi:MAG: hypothetical protein FWG97_01180 [Deltaproteobacteria bacterium]|nr:hypothetical protein [Deltaproteobacteria bacterium]
MTEWKLLRGPGFSVPGNGRFRVTAGWRWSATGINIVQPDPTVPLSGRLILSFDRYSIQLDLAAGDRGWSFNRGLTSLYLEAVGMNPHDNFRVELG